MPALVLQCGGPTAVVNTTLAALVRAWRQLSGDTLFAGRHGLSALRGSDWTPVCGSGFDLPSVAVPGNPSPANLEEWLAALERAPGMALGGSRVRLDDHELQAAVARLAAAGVDTLFLIGGNGTMAAGRELAAHARRAAVRLRVVAVPKTIDNDISCTDVSPGYPSAARFLVHAVRDIAADVSSMRGYEDVVLIETMGRHAGWLAVASVLARRAPDDAPHLVLLPEQRVDVDGVLEAMRLRHTRDGMCVVVVAEGVRDADGALLAARCAEHVLERDPSGQVILGRSGGPLPYLASLVRERLGMRCRLVRPDVLQRCSMVHVSAVDRQLAALAGQEAVRISSALDPGDAIMVALRADHDTWSTAPVPLDAVRGERTVPAAVQADPGVLRPLLA